MKKVDRISMLWMRTGIIAILVCVLPAINGFAAPLEEEESAQMSAGAASEQPGGPLADQKEKRSYALGMIAGEQFRSRSVDVDLDAYLQGVRAGLEASDSPMSIAEASAVVNLLQQELRKRPAAAPAEPGPLAEIRVSFKLDPRLTGSMYMGDRWVSPSAFTSTLQAGEEITVEAQVRGFDARRKAISIKPKWSAVDPDMITITPDEGDLVKITVKREGESILKIFSGEITKEMRIKGVRKGDGMQAEISQ